MKILCVCERGNSRSVALAFLLKEAFGLDALAMGLTSSGDETKRMLYEWADVVILVAGRLRPMIPGEYAAKLKVWDVGDDVYFRGFSDDLMTKLWTYIRRDMVVEVIEAKTT